MKERKRITAYCEALDKRITKVFDEWIFEGKQVQTAQQVADDYFYTAFDKHEYIVENVEDVDNMWDIE